MRTVSVLSITEWLPRYRRNDLRFDVVAGITAALLVGAVSPDVVALETRKHAQQKTNPAPVDPVVVDLHQRRLAEVTGQLPTDRRPLPSVDGYDSLLTGTRHA